MAESETQEFAMLAGWGRCLGVVGEWWRGWVVVVVEALLVVVVVEALL